MSYTNSIKNAGLTFPQTRTKRTKTEGILIHHPDADWTVQQVHNYHTNTNGWNGIGYNLYIDKDGTIYEGRGLDYVGAHCTNYNSKTVGICCRGQYHSKDTSMPDAQFNALVWAINYCKEKYGSGIYVKGHRDVAATSCPGQYFPLSEAQSLIYRGESGTETATPADTSSESTSTQTNTDTATSEAELQKEGIMSFQTWLNKNYNAGLVVDGIYGSKTKTAAIKAMQSIIGVTADGIWGTKSKAACPVLGIGDSGNAVYVLQGMLYCRGYVYSGFDGIFGSMTESEVKSYQGANSLTVDGLPGKETFASLAA